MALFASLARRDGSSTAPSISLLPEAIQLHSNLHIDFLNSVAAFALPSSNSAVRTTTTTATPTATATASGNVLDRDIGGIDSSRNTAFSLLSYQAVQTQGKDDEFAPATANNINARQQRRHHDVIARPDLGIWDCRIVNEENNIKSSSSSITMAAMLLRNVVLNNDRFKASGGSSSNNHRSDKEEKKEDEECQQHGSDGNMQQQNTIPHARPMIMVVDMSELSEIQQQVERMKGVIVNVFDNDDNLFEFDGSSKSHTTSLRALKNCVFGSAAMINDSSSLPTSSDLSPSEDKRIALILAVILPPSTTSTSSSINAADEYKERRARDLVLYHLHKFSMEVDCTLCFVRREQDGLMDVSVGGDGTFIEGSPVTNSLPSISIDEFSKVIRRVALGLSPVEVENIIGIEEENVDNDEATEEDRPSHNIPRQHTPSIYAPGTHDAELVNGVYLRNASCDGSWDAVTDDLIVALPPRSSSSVRSPSDLGVDGAKNTGNGDEDWLSELAQSMGISSDAVSSSASADVPSTTSGVNKETKISTKKRITRASSSSIRDKDAKPKDQKEVLSFFSNLVKK